MIEDYNELNKNVQYDIDKEKDICQKSGNFSDDNKVNKNVTTDKDKTDLNNSNDIIGTSYKHKSSKDDMRRKKDNPVKKKIFILGDSMIKHTKGWEMSSKIDHKHNIYVRSFSGAKVRSMKDYAKPCVKDENPDHIIMHIGTNDLNSEINPELIAKSIADLANGMVSEKRKVTASGIIPRNDKWNKKVEEVNQHLKNMCKIASVDYHDNSSFNPKKHLNNSKLDLNEKGSYKLNSIFLNYITTLFK